MSAEYEQLGPAEGYGAVPFGKIWMPVKWAPEAGEGAYRPLQTSDHRAANGVPMTCPTQGEAYRFTWAAHRAANALQQPAFDMDVDGVAVQPAVVKAKPARRPKGGKAPAAQPAPAPAPVATVARKNPGATGKTWKWGQGKKATARKAS